MTATAASRVAIVVAAVGIAGVVLMLGLWQQVATACSGGGFDPADPIGTCQAPAPVDVGHVATERVAVNP